MNNYFGRALARLHPRAGKTADPVSEAELSRRLVACEAEVRALRREVDELRGDSLRIAELYDLVFERVRDRTL